jgi:hypothetical protein
MNALGVVIQGCADLPWATCCRPLRGLAVGVVIPGLRGLALGYMLLPATRAWGWRCGPWAGGLAHGCVGLALG